MLDNMQALWLHDCRTYVSAMPHRLHTPRHETSLGLYSQHDAHN